MPGGTDVVGAVFCAVTTPVPVQQLGALCPSSPAPSRAAIAAGSIIPTTFGTVTVAGAVVVVGAGVEAVAVVLPLVDVDGATVAVGAGVVVAGALGAGVDAAGAVVVVVGAGAVVVVVGAVVVVGDVVEARWTTTLLGCACDPDVATIPPMPPPMSTRRPTTTILAARAPSFQNVLIPRWYA